MLVPMRRCATVILQVVQPIARAATPQSAEHAASSVRRCACRRRASTPSRTGTYSDTSPPGPLSLAGEGVPAFCNVNAGRHPSPARERGRGRGIIDEFRSRSSIRRQSARRQRGEDHHVVGERVALRDELLGVPQGRQRGGARDALRDERELEGSIERRGRFLLRIDARVTDAHSACVPWAPRRRGMIGTSR